MNIENKNDLQQSLNAAAKQLNNLSLARDKLYTELDQLYSSDSFTDSGRTERENTLRSEYATFKKNVLNDLQNIISDIHAWDNRTTARSAVVGSNEFAATVQVALSIGTTATKDVVEAVLLLGKNRIQVAALCSILADKCTDEAAKQAIADKMYSPDTYYVETTHKLKEYLSTDDFQLEKAAGLFLDICCKLTNANIYVSFRTSPFTDEHKSDVSYSTSTPVTVE